MTEYTKKEEEFVLDLFAGMAMQVLMIRGGEMSGLSLEDTAYDYAEAMVEEKKQRKRIEKNNPVV